MKINRKYKLKKVWPPDYSKLSVQDQLRFEKRYKRRSHLAYLSEGWVKGTKLLQHTVIACEFPFAKEAARPTLTRRAFRPDQRSSCTG